MGPVERMSPDAVVYAQWGWVSINATLVFSWVVIVILTIASFVATARIVKHESPSRWQLLLEFVVDELRKQIREVVGEPVGIYLPFIGTLVLFIGVGNLLMIVPGYENPMASLSTTAALAGAVFFAVPIYGIARSGVRGYLKHYVEPSVLLLPFHLISELSRTLALAVRLFGNLMSEAKIAALLLAVVPLLFPVVMEALGLLIGLIQAYIFAVLALIYIGSATHAQHKPEPTHPQGDA